MTGRVSFHLAAYGRDKLEVTVRDQDGVQVQQDVFTARQAQAPIVAEAVCLWLYDDQSPVTADIDIDFGRARSVQARLAVAVAACRRHIERAA